MDFYHLGLAVHSDAVYPFLRVRKDAKQATDSLFKMITENTLEKEHSKTLGKPEMQLVGMRTCLDMVFPDDSTRPSYRLFNTWKSLGYLPFHKIGKRVFMCPQSVRAALDKQFLVQPVA